MRILLIVSHLSTGGMPQVALKRVEALLNSNNEVYVIEYRQIAWSFVVQRDKIVNLLGDKFISLGNVWGDGEEKRDQFVDIVKNINPDIIHMEEIPENFIFGMKQEHIDWLYRADRPYKIIETTHTSTFDLNQKRYFPDKFMFVSPYSLKEYSRFNIPSSVVEYPSNKLERNKSQSIKKLNLDPEYFHILNVGLFTRDKNQGYVFELAEYLYEYKIQFHFVGNQAENFSDYWKPLMERKLDNCIVHGERNDVDVFYQAADLLIHPSTLELNPLAIKEATSYDLPVFLNNLPTYLNMYNSYKNVKYLSMDINTDVQLILNNFNIKRKDDDVTFDSFLLSEYNSIIKKDIINETINETDIIDDNDYLEYDINFTDGARVEILGKNKLDFDIDIYDKETNSLVYQTKLKSGTWCSTNTKFYREYKINILHNNTVLVTHDFDLTNKNVLIQLDSRSIGDTLAWMPYAEEFRKKHNCKVYLSTFWNNWFVNQYPELVFIEPGQSVNDLYARYSIGWYLPVDFLRNPIDYKKIPLQKTASDILGLDYKEIRPNINIPEGYRPIEEKYVCIAQYSTANTKHWHYPCKDSNKGWQIIVDWLNAQGYKVMVISKQKTNLKNVIDMTGDFPIEHRINQLKWCEFFIGVGSGLSWLAWVVGKKVVMISGFSHPICEFQTNNINVHNFNVCNGCFNKHVFDRGDWNWCPEHKDTERQFECSINITPQMVVDKIVNSNLIENVQPFNFENNEIKLNSEDIRISYIREENKIIFGYSNDDTSPLNIDIKDFHTNKNFHTISDTILSRNYTIWSIPTVEMYKETNKLLISFYEKNKILDIEFDI